MVLGHPSNLIYATLDETGARSQAFRTLFLQETIRRGVLAPSFVVGIAHDDAAIDQTVNAVGEALRVYRRALEDGVGKHLRWTTGQAGLPAVRMTTMEGAWTGPCLTR